MALNLLQFVARPLSDRLLSPYGVWGPANRVAHRSARHPVGILGKGRPIYARTLRRPAEPVDALRLRSIRALGRRTLKDGR